MKNFFFFLLMAPLFALGQAADSLSSATEVDSLIKLNIKLVGAQQFEQALKVVEAAEHKALMAFGEKHPLYANTVFNHGRTFDYMDNFGEAERYYLKTKTLREQIFGVEHIEYAKVLNNLAYIYSATGNYEKAKTLYLNALAIMEKTVGKTHADYAATLNNLAILYYNLGVYEKAELLYTEAKSIWGATLGTTHPHYAACLNNLAILCREMGNYGKSEQLYLESMAIREKELGKEHSDVAASLNNLANLYLEMGIFEKCEPLLLKSKAIREKALGKEHRDYAQSINNLATLYAEMGDYKKSEQYYLESKAIREKTLGKEHPDVAASLNDLAYVYWEMKQYEKCEQLYLESKAIREKTLGKEHPEYATTLLNLAELYQQTGLYEKSESLILEALGILEKTFGKAHPSYAAGLETMAKVQSMMGHYAKSEALYVAAKEVWEKATGRKHSSYAQNLEGLATLYMETGQHKKADTLFVELMQLTQALVTRGLSYLPESELAKYLQKNASQYNLILSFAALRKNDAPVLLAALLDYELFVKGLLLENTRTLETSISKAPDSIREMHLSWKGCQRLLAAEYAKPIAEQYQVAEVEALADSLEKMLVRSIAGFSNTRRSMSWREVQQKLQDGEAALEFVQYNQHNLQGKTTDSTRYAALLLLPGNTAPQWIPLFEQRQIDSLLRSGEARKSNYANRLYTGGSALYDLIWQPLEQSLAKTHKVYFSPCGALHRINFEAIPVTKVGPILSERFELIQMGSTRLLAAQAEVRASNSEAALFGGIRYEADSTALSQALGSLSPLTEPALVSRGELPTDLPDGLASWGYLPFTDREVSGIETILAKNKLKPVVRRGNAATEETFKRIGQSGASPRILHVATHGFFFPDPKANAQKPSIAGKTQVFRLSDNPMMRSGLLFAGANRVWKGGGQLQNIEDGILTAYEISQMNLSNTELVVLSACETGLGDIKGNEGVYGLQRAFKKAGAKYIILSLWQVPDKHTAQLMTFFYRNWLEKKLPIPKAFRTAQQQMRDLGLEPYKWAGFVLVE